MSKEETPIKDLEFYKSNAEEDYMNTPISVLRYITELENNTQAKVLEALEREVPKAFERGSVIAYTIAQGNAIALKNIVTSKEYYETEVKPKYEKERK